MALRVLRARARYRSVSDHIFYNGNGGRIDAGNLRRRFYSSGKKAKIGHFRFHDLRHYAEFRTMPSNELNSQQINLFPLVNSA
jgi:integrase